MPTPPSQAVSRPIDAALEAIVMRCLAKQPSARFASAAELRDALRRVASTDWSDADARGWWREFREIEDAAQSAALTPTKTLTVNLGDDRARLPR